MKKAMSKRARLLTVRDILYCEDSCSKEAYDKIIEMWSGRHIKEVERSSSISAFQTDELTLMNRLFGSAATCYGIDDIAMQKMILKIMPHDLYKNFRRATFKRKMTITMEDWIWELSDDTFLDELDIELTCLSNVIVSLLLYFLGGFQIPVDQKKVKMNDWIKVDVYSLFNRPRELFLLTTMSPAVLSRFAYWKCTAVLMGLMRLFAKKDIREDVVALNRQLEYDGYGLDDKNR